MYTSSVTRFEMHGGSVQVNRHTKEVNTAHCSSKSAQLQTVYLRLHQWFSPFWVILKYTFKSKQMLKMEMSFRLLFNKQNSVSDINTQKHTVKVNTWIHNRQCNICLLMWDCLVWFFECWCDDMLKWYEQYLSKRKDVQFSHQNLFTFQCFLDLNELFIVVLLN